MYQELFSGAAVTLPVRRESFRISGIRTAAQVIASWTAPRMSTGRLLFALLSTAYMLVAMQLGERDLAKALGEPYTEYRRRVPVLPFIGKRAEQVSVAPVKTQDA